MRFSTVSAWNTSRLAYDGSGAVTRDSHNHSLCTFKNGKRYNCDLSASYNIGARYFAREIWKSLPEKAASTLKAKVPELWYGAQCTIASGPILVPGGRLCLWLILLPDGKIEGPVPVPTPRASLSHIC